MKLARNGKPVNGVLAPVIRISAVATCTSTCPTLPYQELPNAASATWLITVGVPSTYGVACVFVGQVRDAQHERAEHAAHDRQGLASILPSGRLNALTPFEIASRPVSDAPPFANALSR